MKEIIVYRNPIEANFWEMVNTNPEYILYGIGIAVLIVVLYVLGGKVVEKVKAWRYRQSRW